LTEGLRQNSPWWDAGNYYLQGSTKKGKGERSKTKGLGHVPDDKNRQARRMSTRPKSPKKRLEGTRRKGGGSDKNQRNLKGEKGKDPPGPAIYIKTHPSRNKSQTPELHKKRKKSSEEKKNQRGGKTRRTGRMPGHEIWE